MFWPPQSPELNPIGNAWAYLKFECRKNSQLAKNKDELFQWISELWYKISQQKMHCLRYCRC